MWKLLREHWQQAVFAAVGSVLLVFCFRRLLDQDITGASAIFAMAFLSFIYSNLARFKRFKGLGFEAELWEDKQKEVEQLTDRLKAVVSVYTREVVLQKVMQGRWSSGAKWRENWNLYDELVAKHDELGQSIDFSDLKAKLDKVFLFDIVRRPHDEIRSLVWDAKEEARKVIQKEFGSPISDAEGYNRRNSQLQQVPENLRDLFEMSMAGNVAQDVLDWAAVAKVKLKEHFDIDIELPAQSVEQLEMLSRICQAGPIKVTDELIEMAG